MKGQIWKFRLEHPLSSAYLERGHIDVLTPDYPSYCRFAMQGGVPCFWAQVDPAAALMSRRYLILATGADIPPFAVHIGSCEEIREHRNVIEGPLHRTSLIWHLFEIRHPIGPNPDDLPISNVRGRA